jgi:transcriptional regulator with XRE-family HTH domain
MYPKMASKDEANESPLSQFIRTQRELQELSMRQLADLAGISNPYLSQIERGLREPSEKVVDAIARHLEVSAEGLQERGGRRRTSRQDEEEESAVVAAIHADKRLSARQRRALLEVYAAFTGGASPRRGGRAAVGRGARAPRPTAGD